MVLEGQRSVTAGLASVLGATTPLFVILLAHVFTSDEKISLAKLTGVLIGMVGVATVFGPEVFDGWTTAAGAKALLVGAAVLYAAGAIWSKRLTGHPPLAMATMQMTAGLILTAPLSLLLEQPWTIAPPSWLAITGIFGTAIFGSALAAVTYFHVFRRAGATNAMLVTLLVPVTPILIGAALFGEHLLAREAIGALVIAFALVVIDGRLFAALRRRLKGPA
jgi:drug/metabolite transporter (DMT)-like permease